MDPSNTEHQADFGFRTVAASEKARLVRGVFDSVARRYDIMNDAMSLGIHRVWKRQFIAQISPRPGWQFLDVAGGTGDIAFGIHQALKNRRHFNALPDAGSPAIMFEAGSPAITVCDINQNMVSVGRNRAIDRGWLHDINWVVGNAESLPVPDQDADVYTIAFGLRNVTDKAAALAEAWRVLKPGGRFFCLEFSKVNLPGFDRLYDFYSFALIPPMGQLLAGDRDSYQYLIESIRQFPDQQKLAGMMKDVGMTHISIRNLSGGIAAIHSARKACA